MSFFDEEDEPPRTETRTPPRSTSRAAPRRRGSSGGSGSGGSGRTRPGGRGPRRPAGRGPDQSILVRRAVAAAAIIIVIILIAVGVDSCQSSARKSALQDYANSVSSLITRSDNTSAALFRTLGSAGGSGNATTTQNQINETRANAQTVLSDAQKQSAPDSAKTANAHLLLALRMRLDGITNIANEIQPALGTSVSKDAVDNIAGEMARFYASDVLYKSYTVPALVSALHANKIAVGGANGESINAGQFLPSIQWLDPTHVSSALHVSLPGGSKNGKPAPGLHGDSLSSVSVNGTTLQSGATNTVAAKPAPTFTLSFTNGGTNDETDVKCKVSVTGTGVSGLKIVPKTTAGQSATCAVTLRAAPPAGTYSVVATIEKVPGETNMSNNSLTFPVTFN